jgi:DNA-binding CsgD family transcriptional regulator
MASSGRLRVGDVRAALRLIGECRDLGYDPGQWVPHMLDGLCRLAGARAGNGAEVRMVRPDGLLEGVVDVMLSGTYREVRKVRPDGSLEGVSYFDAGFTAADGAVYLKFLTTRGLDRHPTAAEYAAWQAASSRPGRVSTRTRRQVFPDPEWYASALYNECHRVIRIDHTLGSVREFAPGGLFHCINLHRATGEPDFSGRQRRLLNLFHAELGPLIGSVLVPGADPRSPDRLPPRVRQTLACLLEGDGEKQAAARMGLSVPTVHQYVKALYRHYSVSTRAELLARVLRRPTPCPGPGAPPA